jgi:hypothetical protein
MALAARVQPFERDLQLLLDDLVSPEQRSAALAEFAREEIDKAKAINARALGQVPPLKIFVDGHEGAPLTSVRPTGIIVADFQLVNELLEWIDLQLLLHSPMKTGRYMRSHRLFADGLQVQIEGRIPANVPAANEYVFINIVPYARKIERGSSTQAPEGVYQVVAVLAQRRFGNLARISFSYRTAIGGGIIGGKLGNRAEQRNPAIVVRQRT